MSKLSRALTTIVFAASTVVSTGNAQGIKLGDLQIEQPWSRATPPGATVGSGYLTITNKGTVADRLVGGSTPVASKVELHQMTMKDNVMTMRPIADGLPIEPGKALVFSPGDYHIMFVGLKAPLQQGSKVTATLQFQKAGKVDVTFDVQGVGAMGPTPHPSNSDHKM